eukprot:gene46836-58409_t
MGKTLFDKIWDSHVITDLGNGFVLLHIDRLLLHDMSGGKSLKEAIEKGYPPSQPRLIYGTPDHTMSTKPGRTEHTHPPGLPLIKSMRETTSAYGIKLFDLGQDGQGIVHVMGPEQGLTLPGTTLVCGDSHTSTHGAFGALAFGIGTSEVEHVLATQTLIQKPAKNMRVAVEGSLPLGVTAKDVILAIIGKLGTAGGTGYVIEYAGRAIRELTMEGRMTVCNMSIEAGARAGLIAPDETTFKYLQGRPFAPKGGAWDLALSQWRRLPSDKDAHFDVQLDLNASDIPPMVTWGTSPQDALPITDVVPDPANAPDENRREAWTRSL